MTAPTHTRAEVEQLAERYRTGEPEMTPELADLIATALYHYAASIGVEPAGWLVQAKNGIWAFFADPEGVDDFRKRGCNIEPLYTASPTYRECELSGIEKAAKLYDHKALYERSNGNSAGALRNEHVAATIRALRDET